MPLAALLAVLLAALTHASWNLVAKSAVRSVHFVWLYSMASLMLWTGPVTWVVMHAHWHPGPLPWLALGATALLHLAYSLALQAGYRAADLSLVYPIARGTGPLLSFAGAALLLGEPIGLISVVGVLLVVSGIAYYPSYLQSHPAGGGSLANYFATWQTPLQWMSGAAWFIGALLLYDCVLSAVQAFAPGILDWISKLCAGSNDTLRFYALVVGLSAIAYLPMVVIFGAYDWFNLGPFWIQKCRVLLYGLYFFLGAGVGGAGLSTSLAAPGSNLAKRWYAWAIAAILVFLVAGNLQLLSLNHHTYDDPLWRLIVGVGWILSCATSAFALLAIFVRFANTPNRVFESLSTNSYGMYLTHYAMVTWTQYALLASSIPPLTKALAVIAVAAAGSWLLTMALRWIPAVARII